LQHAAKISCFPERRDRCYGNRVWPSSGGYLDCNYQHRQGRRDKAQRHLLVPVVAIKVGSAAPPRACYPSAAFSCSNDLHQDHWRNRAAMMRVLIPCMENAKTKATMTKLGQSLRCDKRADAGEARTPGSKLRSKRPPAERKQAQCLTEWHQWPKPPQRGQIN